MSINLPPTLGTGSSGGFGSLTPNTGRAGNFDTMKLNQQKEREAATTSIAHPGGRREAASTSVSHPGGARQGASTSVSHPGSMVGAGGDDDWDEEGADRRRDAHIHKLIRDRQEKEAEDAASSGGGTQIKKGSAFKSGATKKILRKLILKSGRTGLTDSEKQLMTDVVSGTARAKTVGKTFTEKDKKAMIRQVYKQRGTGVVSQGFNRIKRIIGGLE